MDFLSKFIKFFFFPNYSSFIQVNQILSKLFKISDIISLIIQPPVNNDYTGHNLNVKTIQLKRKIETKALNINFSKIWSVYNMYLPISL